MDAIKFRLVQFLTLPYESLVYYTPCQPWMRDGQLKEKGSVSTLGQNIYVPTK